MENARAEHNDVAAVAFALFRRGKFGTGGDDEEKTPMQMTPPVRRRRRSAFSFIAAGAVPTVTSFAAAVIVTALLLAVPARAFSSSLAPPQSSSTRRAAPFRCVGSRRFAMSVPSSSSSSSDAGGTMTNGRDGFTEKKAFESRIAAIERTAAATLEGFYDPRLKSFSVKPGGNVNRLSVTSTCFALQAILAGNDGAYDALIQLDPKASAVDDEDGGSRRIMVRSVLVALLGSEWREDDLFQVPLLLYTLLRADPDRHLLAAVPDRGREEVTSQLRRLVSAALDARPRRRHGVGQHYSDYILYQCSLAYAALQQQSSTTTTTSSSAAAKPSVDLERPAGGNGDDGASDDDDGDGNDDEVPSTSPSPSPSRSSRGIGGLPDSALPEGAANLLSLALARSVEVSSNELCRQLAFRAAGDEAEFDVMRLAYSLLAYVTSSDALSGMAGLELVPGQGPSPGTQTGPANKKLVRAGLRAFFDEQMRNGLWDKGQPIYKSFRKQGRNVGNAFVFGVDTLASLLEKLPAEEFRPYLNNLERTLTWIEQQQTVEVIPDYCDDESGQCFGKPLRGWASPHLSPDTSPQGWSTAQALSCVSQMRRQVRTLMNSDVLEMFGGQPFSDEGPVETYWDRLLDSDLGNCGYDRCRTLKDVLDERMIEPFKESVSKPTFGAAYSAILFGPPGTAKTTICESLAKKLGWDFVVIDTSVFLADGLGNVAARIRYVFERLQTLDRCVVLFDEIEEFCLDRETPGLGMESRMLTTAMLTAINDLRRAKRSIFFLATNRLRAFDSAITRPGRFDMQLFVGTPNLGSRCTQFRQQLSKVFADDETKQKAMQEYESFLSSEWKETAQFMNFLEGQQFASACADIVASGTELTNDVMKGILDVQAAVMTVRGTTREEFVASMGLSRL